MLRSLSCFALKCSWNLRGWQPHSTVKLCNELESTSPLSAATKVLDLHHPLYHGSTTCENWMNLKEHKFLNCIYFNFFMRCMPGFPPEITRFALFSFFQWWNLLIFLALIFHPRRKVWSSNKRGDQLVVVCSKIMCCIKISQFLLSEGKINMKMHNREQRWIHFLHHTVRLSRIRTCFIQLVGFAIFLSEPEIIIFHLKI